MYDVKLSQSVVSCYWGQWNQWTPTPHFNTLYRQRRKPRRRNPVFNFFQRRSTRRGEARTGIAQPACGSHVVHGRATCQHQGSLPEPEGTCIICVRNGVDGLCSIQISLGWDETHLPMLNSWDLTPYPRHGSSNKWTRVRVKLIM